MNRMRCIFLVAAFLMAAASCTGHKDRTSTVPDVPKEFITPDFLKAGDRVAIVAPSYRADQAVVDELCILLQEWDLVPVVGQYITGRYPEGITSPHYFAASAEKRAADLLSALEDTSIKAIIAAGGGYGAMQVLDFIPRQMLHDNPKWLIGFEDFTSLLSEELMSGVKCIHGPFGIRLADSNYGRYAMQLHDILFGALPSYTIPANEYDVDGEAEGVLVGGDMLKLRALTGTEYDIAKLDDIILFLEVSGTRMSVIDGALNTLFLRGAADHIRGIVFGELGAEANLNYSSVEQMLHSEYFSRMDIPVCFGFPSGYGAAGSPLVFGNKVVLKVSDTDSELIFR